MRPAVVSTVSALLGSISVPSAGAVMTVGGPLSSLCYDSANAGDTSLSAVDACTRALEQEPLTRADRAATHVNRGIVLMSMDRSDAADKDFDAASHLNTNLADAWLNKGFLRLRLGRGREALPFIQKGIDLGASGRAKAIFARGVAHEQMGDFALAYADLRLAQRLDPSWRLPSQYLATYRVGR